MEELVNGLHNDNFNAGDRAFGIVLDAIQPGKKIPVLPFVKATSLALLEDLGKTGIKIRLC